MLIHELCTHPFECHACSELIVQCFVSTDPCSRVDLLFILDTSNSVIKIDSKNWNYILGFAKSFVDQLAVSPNGAHVGVVMFGNNGVLMIKLNEFTDADLLKAGIDKLVFKDQLTNIYGGLEEAKNAFKPANGARYNVYKVAIFITGGEKANDRYTDPQATAADLKNSGVEVFVVSHSHYFSKNESTMTLVETIASAPLIGHLFISDDFWTLTNYVQRIKDTMDKSCGVIGSTKNPFESTKNPFGSTTNPVGSTTNPVGSTFNPETPTTLSTFVNWCSFSIYTLTRVYSVSLYIVIT